MVAHRQPVGEKRRLPGDRRRANRRSAASVRGHAHAHTLYWSQLMTRACTRQPGLAVRRPASRKIDREPAPRPRAACAAKARDSSRSQTRTNRGSQEFACVPGPHAISPTASHRLTQPEATHRRRCATDWQGRQSGPAWCPSCAWCPAPLRRPRSVCHVVVVGLVPRRLLFAAAKI